MTIEESFIFIGNGIDQSNILVLFAMLDLIIAISCNIKNNDKMTSRIMLSGIIHNFIPAFFPAIIYLMNTVSKTHSEIYMYASFIIFACVSYFVLQSILRNLNILGLKLPTFILKWINSEIELRKASKKKETKKISHYIIQPRSI